MCPRTSSLPGARSPAFRRNADRIPPKGGTTNKARRGSAAIGAVVAAFTGLLLTGCGDQSAVAGTKAESAKVAAPDTAWPMTRGGPSLNGNVAAPIPLGPKTVWTFTASGPVAAEAAIRDGRVYVGTNTGTLHCLSADTGRELWRFETKDAITAAPAVTATMVFVSSNDGALYALSRDTGVEAWHFATEEKISAGATVIKNPTGDGEWVLLNGYDGTTRALDAADGKVIWSYKTENFINGAPAIVDGKYVVFGGCDAHLHVVNIKDGTLVHQIEAGAYIPASIATFGGMAFCGNYANQTVAFDVTGGRVAWVYEDHRLPFVSSPAVNDRLVLIGSRDKQLHAIERETGKSAWKFGTGGRVEGSPLVFRNGVVFASADGRLYAASLDAGAELWQLDLGESLVASPAYGHHQIVIGGEGGSVFAIRGGAQRGTPATKAGSSESAAQGQGARSKG